MHFIKKIVYINLMLLALCVNKLYAQVNPSILTYQTNQTVPADETRRAEDKIILKADAVDGFKYGAGASGSRLTLQISNYENYVENGYQQVPGICAYPTPNNPLVGEVEGNFSVSLTGSAIYEIPLKVSPGASGMQPNLSLVYASGSGSGMMGLGWSLQGLSSISRINKTPYLDTKYEAVKLSATDIFALDGNRLMLTTGVYGAANSTYGTELESFANITAISQQGSGPQSFVVVDKNGTTSEYGYTADSKLTGIGDNTPLIWYVNKVKDVYGNYIEYFYKQLNGEVVIERIAYTKNAASTSTDVNEITFDYISKTEKNTMYVGDKEFKSTQLLKKITSNFNNNLVKRYVLNYQYVFNTLLSDVTEVNQDGSQLKATNFCYDDPYYNSTAQYSSQNTSLYTVSSDYANIKTIIPADLNGDGFSDAIVVKPIVNVSNPQNKFEARRNDYPNGALNGGTMGFSSMPVTNSTAVSSTTILASFALDTDFDDKQEVYLMVNDASNTKKYHVQKLLDIGTATIPDIQATTIKPNLATAGVINVAQSPSKFYFDISDYNGDGINDELIIDPEKISITSSLGDKTFIIPAPTKSVARPFDFDGDGYLEVVLFSNSLANNSNLSITVLKYTSATNLVSVATENITFPASSQDLLKLISIGDYNGDGKGDIAYLNETKQNLKIIYSTGSDFSVSKPVNSFSGLNSSINYNIISPDINGDGISDIIFTDNVAASATQNYTSYYSIGDMFVKGLVTQGKFNYISFDILKFYPKNSIFKPLTQKYGSTTVTVTEKINIPSNFQLSADFNGDGVFDVVTLDALQTKTILNDATAVKTQYLSRVTTGLNKQIDISYANPHTKFDVGKNSVYTKNANSYNGSLVAFTPGNYLVSLVKQNNTNLINLSKEIRYFYQGAIFHKYGKGFLGFEKSSNVCTNTLLGTISSFSPSATYQVAEFTSIETGKFSSSNAVGGITEYFLKGASNTSFDARSSKTTTTLQITPTSGSAIFVAPGKILSKDFLNSSESFTQLTYDLTKNGNITNQLVKYGWTGAGSGTGLGVLRTENTSITYQNTGSLPYFLNGVFKPDIITQTFVQGTDLPYSRTTQYNYAGFNLTSVVNDPSSNPLTATLTNYNVYGARQKVVLSSADILSRTYETIYDLSGRFVIKTINSKLQEEEFIYDQKYGSLLQKKDISGLISKYGYDGVGRLINTQLPDNTLNTISYDYVPLSSGKSVFSKTVNNEGSPYFTTYYNHLGNVTGTQTEDVNGKTIVTDNEYHYNTGFLTQTSEPHFISTPPASYLITKYSYESIFSRLIKEEVFAFDPGSPYTPSPQGIYTEYIYNSPSRDFANGNYSYVKGLVSKTDQTHKITTKTINGAGQLDEVKNYEGFEPLTGIPTPPISDYQKTEYAYHSNGQPKSITLSSTSDANLITHLFAYNAFGQQTQLVDPSAGTINFTYDRLNELLHQDDANGSYDYTYDILGRIETKTGSTSGLTSYDYVLGNDGKNQIAKITGPNVITEYAYDALGRTKSFKETVTGGTPKIFTTLADYDKYSNITQYTYPGGFVAKYNYSNGFLTTILDNSNNPIWQLNDQNALGQITGYSYGNGINTVNNYTGLHYLSSIEHGNIHKQMYNFNPEKGNLDSREFFNYDAGHLSHNIEKFTFDGLDRLRISTQVDQQDNPIYINAVDIDEKGNILHKDDAGDFVYSNTAKPFNLTQINNPTPNISLNTLNMTYNDIRKVSLLSEAATNKEMKFTYGNNDERVKVEYKINNINQYTRYYQSNYETEESGSNTKEWTYIYAPTGLAAVFYKPTTSGTGNLLYALTDHLGSPVLLTDQSQTIQEEYSFDSWGRRRNPVDWTYTATAPTILNRGFTFHEHIDEFNLVNMNGRVYDPVLGRFLQPDNQVQLPDYLQTYNRYAYVFNNPLSYTDPSGWGAGLYESVYTGGTTSYLFSSGPCNGCDAGYTNAVTADPDLLRGYMMENGIELGPGGTGPKSTRPGGNTTKGSNVSTAPVGASRLSSRSIYLLNGLDNKPSYTVKSPYNGTPQSNTSQSGGGKVIDNNRDAISHYFSGDGSPVKIGPNSVMAVLTSPDFQKKYNRIKDGKTTSLKGNFSVDLTSNVFHIGHTNVNYSINLKTNGNITVKYDLFVDDGFWDVDFIDEGIGSWFGIKNKPDGLGPNLERLGGTPYPYIPSTVIFNFPNPGYK
jgi:RHS repeat-associated protein